MHRTLPSWLRWTLTACIISAVAVFPSTQAPRAAGAVTLTWEFQNGTFWPAIVNTIVKAYTKTHPNVTFKLQPVDASTYTQKLFIQASAGTLSDIIETADAFNVPFAVNHIALNMQPYLDADPSYNASDLYQNFLSLGRLSGQPGLYMMPFSADAVVTFYNKDMFKAAGVPFPKANWTYADFLSAAQKLTKKDSSGKTVQWGMELLPVWWAVYVPWMEGFGGSLLTPDGKHVAFSSPGSVAGFQALQDLFTKYGVAVPPTVQLPGDAFISGKAAMTFTVHAAVPGETAGIGNKFKWDVQEMPSFPSGKHVNGMGTAGFAISTNSRQRAAAWDVVKFVGSVQGQKALAATGSNMPTRKSLQNDPSWRNVPLNNDAFVKAIKYGIFPPQLPTDAALNCGTVYTGEMSTLVATAYDKIARGAPVAATLQPVDAQINQCIDSLGN